MIVVLEKIALGQTSLLYHITSVQLSLAKAS